MKTTRMVEVLHKGNDKEGGGGLAVGKTFRFSSGTRYTVQENGSVINADPKRHASKAERKAQKRLRRDSRGFERPAT